LTREKRKEGELLLLAERGDQLWGRERRKKGSGQQIGASFPAQEGKKKANAFLRKKVET